MTKTLMEKTITKALLRGACLATLAVLGLAVTPGTARADFIIFTVVEGAVDGTPDNTFSADLLNGGYDAFLALFPAGGDTDPTDGSGSGTWSETATATFSQYFLDGDALATPLIGDIEDDGYVILGSLTSGGTYVEDTCGFNSCIVFTFTSQTGTLGIDDDQDGVVDDLLLTATGVGPGTGGVILFTGGVTGGTGSFVSNFSNNTLAGGIAPDYWPTLENISFITTISGDVNELDLPNVTGDVSVQFTQQQVPEPAALSLLGLGLVAGVFSRRRASKA